MNLQCTLCGKKCKSPSGLTRHTSSCMKFRLDNKRQKTSHQNYVKKTTTEQTTHVSQHIPNEVPLEIYISTYKENNNFNSDASNSL